MRPNWVSYLCATGLLLASLAACSKGEQMAGEGETVSVQLAMSLSGGNIGGNTKASSITELAGGESSFRGMTDIRILPFSRKGTIQDGDESLGLLRRLPNISANIVDAVYTGNIYHNGIVRNNHAHLFPDTYAALPKGTASALVYGSAPRSTMDTEQETKHLNGSLIESGLTLHQMASVSDIYFDPDPIFTGSIPSEASMLASIMTRVAQAVTYTQTYYYKRNDVWYEGHLSVSWDENLADETLNKYYTWFTGGGELITGAGVSVEYLLSTLYGRLRRYENDDEEPVMHLAGGVEYPTVLTEGGTDVCTYAHLYNGLCNEILKRFNDLLNWGHVNLNTDNTVTFLNSDLRRYPESAGLPSGAAVLRWNGLNFVVVSDSLDGIAAMSNFCYMPPLYYFLNSTLSTSSDLNIELWYTSSFESWGDIVGNYRQGKAVTMTTRGVALDQPMQFAVSQFAATVRATSSLLPDNDDDPRTNCSVAGTNFPVTGILIGRQHRQNFEFEPVENSAEYYLYDNQFSGTYLTAAESQTFRTPVLPVPAGVDVYFFLELRNDSGATFTGAEGLILPGNYFYLAGKLERSEDPAYPQVFMKDHMTTANLVISSFENAHLAVPEMGDPTLVMGVQTTVNWIMSASSYVVLD